MTAKILDGKAVSRTIAQEIAADVAGFRQRHGREPGIAVVQVGSDPASSWYVRQIRRSFTGADMRFDLHTLEESATADEFAALMRGLNADERADGVIVQMPLPEHLPATLVTGLLDPAKDVDGIHPVNAGKLMQGLPDAFVPATPAGGMELLRRYGVQILGKHAVMVGRSNIVGRPMALLLLHQHATVTICHSRTPDLGAVTRQADILAVAVGRPHIVTGDMVKPGSVVIDFGVNVVDDKLQGDVDTESATEVAGYITPVPGGTGPVTNVMLLANTLAAARRQVSE